MNTKYKKLAIGLVVVALMFLGSIAYAQPVGEDSQKGHGQKGEKIEKLHEELGITPEQSEELKAQRQEYRSKMTKIKEALKAKQKEMREELKKPEPNKGKVYSIVAVVKSLQGELIDLRVAHILHTKTILTPEQEARLQELGKGRMGKHGGRGGFRKNAEFGI